MEVFAKQINCTAAEFFLTPLSPSSCSQWPEKSDSVKAGRRETPKGDRLAQGHTARCGLSWAQHAQFRSIRGNPLGLISHGNKLRSTPVGGEKDVQLLPRAVNMELPEAVSEANIPNVWVLHPHGSPSLP